ncbi:hypothetical protein ACFOYU_11515 [Microvirga sp. GCM10011540]
MMLEFARGKVLGLLRGHRLGRSQATWASTNASHRRLGAPRFAGNSCILF